MKRKEIMVALLIFACLLTVEIGHAGEVTPYADSVFNSAYPALSTSKGVTFSATTYVIKNSISVTSCRLEKKISDYTWMGVGSLTPPSYVATNTIGYTAYVDYSANIGSGTYMVFATFNADGHSITRGSNERTF